MQNYDGDEKVLSATSEEVVGEKTSLARGLLRWGVEERGIHPVPFEQRTDREFSKIFFIFLSANTNILSFSAGLLGPLVFGLNLRDSCLVILFSNAFFAIPPAYFATWGPRLGMRQMCASRFTFGFYGTALPSVLSLMNGFGFSILNCVLGGQALSSVSDGTLSWTVGIVIIAVISLVISFFGIKFLTWYERLAWLPMLVVFCVAVGVSRHDFANTASAEPATAAGVLGYIATAAGFTLTYSPFGIWRIFIYAWLGLTLPIVLVQCLGTAVAVAAPGVPSWNAAYKDDNVGGIIAAMLSPVGGFGKFLLVVLSLSVTANLAPTLYSICFAMQTFIPPLVNVPRYVFSVFATAIIIPLAIVGQHRFYTTLTNFTGIIGYWVGAYVSALLIEHLYFRRGDFNAYDVSAWNVPSELPWGAAALSASVLSFALIIPSMAQAWYTGPIGEHVGDLGFEFAVVVTAILYVPFRVVEKRLAGR
ncbi:NCS cytosine-purine permease [Vararia minispora EC-137]|uniref:NCS cytosine-purine permease n=1 Tax=Vararia minispora EC-137 TaxID=1314806 RepID=A0ACB8QZY7_9AGAM|nr:NCS cytosine-purine permease [Vararia minispora EC-137]